jgi:biopolymer transport protein ExbD
VKNTHCHFLFREPGMALPIVALVANLLFVSWLFLELRSQEPYVRLSVASSATARPGQEIPVLRAAAGGELYLQGARIRSLTELETVLGDHLTPSAALVLQAGPEVSAHVIARLLELCARAGFMSVQIEAVGN